MSPTSTIATMSTISGVSLEDCYDGAGATGTNVHFKRYNAEKSPMMLLDDLLILNIRSVRHSLISSCDEVHDQTEGNMPLVQIF